MGPDFALFNQDEHIIPLGRALNNAEQVIVYFFPQPGSPGCTLEANGFRDIMPHLTARNIRVIGITTGPNDELKAFAKANNLNFDVLYDADRRISAEWGALRGEHSARVTFILNYKGVVTHAWTRVNVYTHAAEVLAAVGGPLEAAPAPEAAPVAPAHAAAVIPAAAPVAAAPVAAAAPVVAAAAPVVAAAPPAAAPVAATAAGEASLGSAPADLIVAAARATLHLLLAHQRGGGAVPQDVVDLTAQIALAAQLARR